MILDLLKRLGGMTGGGLDETDEMPGAGQAMQQPAPNQRHALQGQVGDPGDFVGMMRQGRRTGEMPGGQLSMGPAGANYNQTTPEAMAFPQQSVGDIPSLFDNFESERFGKRLARLGAAWSVGQDFNDSLRRGNTAIAAFGDQQSQDDSPEDEPLAGLLGMILNGRP